MAEKNPGKPAAAAAGDWEREEFRALPLEISARLAVGSANLEALRQLAPGTVVPLDTLIGETAELVAHGAVLGAGEIVEVKGRLALRLTRMGKAHA